MDKNFTEIHLYCKVFVRKTLKVFSSCMPNKKQLILAHNRKMLDTQDKERQMCDCKKQEWPVNGNCLMENIIYKATFITENQIKFYVGSTGLSFKNRYTKHKSSFKHEKHKSTTTLSQYILKLKNNKVNLKIHWELLTRSKINIV